MSDTIIIGTRSTLAPDYGKTAAGLLEACRMFYQIEENETEYQEWKKSRKEEKRNVAVDRDRVRCG